MRRGSPAPLARHQPVEQVADGRQPLLDDRRADIASQRLDPGRDMERRDDRDRRHATRLTPSQKVASRAHIGASLMRVADRHREELKEAQPDTFVGRRDQGRRGTGAKVFNRAGPIRSRRGWR